MLDFLITVTRKIRRAEWQMKELIGEKRNPTTEKEGIKIMVYE